MMIIMAFIQYLDIKVPCIYILMNPKTQKSYEIVLQSVFNIITNDNNRSFNINSISTDFKEGLINATNKIFLKVRKIGCLFHFIKNIRLNLNKIGLYNTNISDKIDILLSRIGTIPFKIQNNNKIIDEIFNEFEKYYKDD